MADVKVCPKCRVEYYAHVSVCADCKVPLRFPEEIQAAGREAPLVSSDDEWVGIKRDAKGWIEELSGLLSENGIPSRVELADGCKAGSCGAQYFLLVPKDAAEDAVRRVEDYFVEMHPEAGQSDEWASEGKCPACGHAVEADMKECPDCGLWLAADEDEEDCGGGSCR